jgi:hypothetical protein
VNDIASCSVQAHYKQRRAAEVAIANPPWLIHCTISSDRGCPVTTSPFESGEASGLAIVTPLGTDRSTVKTGAGNSVTAQLAPVQQKMPLSVAFSP